MRKRQLSPRDSYLGIFVGERENKRTKLRGRFVDNRKSQIVAPYRMQYRYSKKRPRAGTYNSNAAKRATWAQRKFSRVAPWSTHGAARVERGTAYSRNLFGPSYYKANKQQRAGRKTTGFTGRGLYSFKRAGKYARKAYNFVNKPGFRKGFKRGFGLGADALSLAAVADPELLPFAAVGQGASKYMGRGTYTKKNGLISGSMSSMPTMRNVNDETGTLVVSHRERLMDVFAPADSGNWLVNNG